MAIAKISLTMFVFASVAYFKAEALPAQDDLRFRPTPTFGAKPLAAIYSTSLNLNTKVLDVEGPGERCSAG